MELPAPVMIFNSVYEQLNAKPGILIAIHPAGVYEVTVKFKERRHTVLLPIASTVLVFQEALLEVAPGFEIER